jgi:hypothetical protein
MKDPRIQTTPAIGAHRIIVLSWSNKYLHA